MDTVLRLKKQWALRCVDGKYTITNEMIQLPIAPEFEGLMIKLAKGVEPGELEDQEFEKLERVNHLLSQDQHPDAPAWEMGGAYFHSVQQQLEHVTLFVYDRSTNGFGADLELRLLDAGCQTVPLGKQRLTIYVCESLFDLPDAEDVPILPVICNRMRISVGPLVLKGRPHIRDIATRSPTYYVRPTYRLPKHLDDLQLAWLTTIVVQFIAMCNPQYVDSLLEFNLATLIPKWNPVE